MTQDNIVRIYISAMKQFDPETTCSASEWDWMSVDEYANKMIQEIQPLLDAYETPNK